VITPTVDDDDATLTQEGKKWWLVIQKCRYSYHLLYFINLHTAITLENYCYIGQRRALAWYFHLFILKEIKYVYKYLFNLKKKRKNAVTLKNRVHYVTLFFFFFGICVRRLCQVCFEYQRVEEIDKKTNWRTGWLDDEQLRETEKQGRSWGYGENPSAGCWSRPNQSPQCPGIGHGCTEWFVPDRDRTWSSRTTIL